jgi:8-oxo-dGTP pyrophosphatase MutT (NUDIX family)
MRQTRQVNENNPWSTVSSVTAYENAWIRVDHREVIRPDGQPGVYGVVHFRNRATAVVPLADNGDTWLVGQYRYATNCYSWEVPEGGVPFDEDLMEGSRRELREETGLVAHTLRQVGRCYLSNSVTDEEAFVFMATGLAEGEAEPEGTELLQLRRLPFDHALDMVDAGEITDGFSVIALNAVDRWKRSSQRSPDQ